MTETTIETPSPGAERMRRYRERKAQGTARLSLELDRRTVDALVTLNWLREDQRSDDAVVETAFAQFVGHALAVGLPKPAGV